MIIECDFIVVVINEADGLTKDAQHALRRTMEKYMNNMRVIMCCNTISKIIGPIRSRCLLIRIPLPTEVEVRCHGDMNSFVIIYLHGFKVYRGLQHVATQEKIVLPENMAKKLIQASERNLRKALLIFEASKVRQ
jgi:replication factor C subunit 3/5